MGPASTCSERRGRGSPCAPGPPAGWAWLGDGLRSPALPLRSRGPWPCLSGAGGLVGGGAAPLRVLCSDSLRARWSFQKQKCDRRLTLSVPSSTAARGSRAGLPLRMPVAFKETLPAGSEAEGRARGWRPNRSGSPGPAADLACALGVQLGARYLDHDCHTGETAGSGRLSPSRPVRPARQP